MTSAPTIRRERPDQPEVAALLDGLDRYLASLYPPEANHIMDAQALAQPGVDFFVARDAAGVAVGTVAVRRCADVASSARPAYGEIKRMVVDPGSRGQGVGAALLEAAETALVEQGVAWARLETGGDQVEAVRLYRRAGYLACPAFGGYPDNGLSMFLEKRLR